jgi:predicted SnoaL-like aldol condensation-catalyzing enzyme
MSGASAQTTLEHNKDLVVRWFDEVWNQGRRATIHELYGTECVLRDGDNTYTGPDEFMRFYDALREQFSKFSVKPIVSLAENDLACLHWSVDCVHTATGQPVHVTGMSIVRVKDGRFVEAWQNWDAAGVAAQVARHTSA